MERVAQTRDLDWLVRSADQRVRLQPNDVIDDPGLIRLAIADYLTRADDRHRAVVCMAAGIAACERTDKESQRPDWEAAVRLAQALVNRSHGRVDLRVAAGVDLANDDAVAAELRTEVGILHVTHGAADDGLREFGRVAAQGDQRCAGARMRACAYARAVLAAQGKPHDVADLTRHSVDHWPKHWESGPPSVPVSATMAWSLLSQNSFRRAARELARAVRVADPVEFWTFLAAPLIEVLQAGGGLPRLAQELAVRDATVLWSEAPPQWRTSRDRLMRLAGAASE